MAKLFMKFIYAGVILIALHSEDLKAGIKRVWAIDDGEKIKKEDINNPLATDPNNAVWQNNTVNIFGGRNEIVAFQLMIQADASGAKDVNVVISDLKNGRSIISGSASGSPNPFDYRGRNVELFTEHYLNIVKRSPPAWFYAQGSAPSDYYTGWVPDCLIPFSAPPGKGGAPFSIQADKNQGVWVDILIPKDASPGIYKGKAILTVSKEVYKSIPVLLKVYDFRIPDETHIKNMFGISKGALESRHGTKRDSEEYWDLESKYFQMAHRHRFHLMREVPNLGEMNQHFRKYLTGEIFTPEHGYAGPGEGVGNTSFSIGYGGDGPEEYGGSINNMTEASWWSGSDAWENWFIKNAPEVERHKFLFPDEPDWKGPPGALGTGSMDTIRMQSKWTHNNPGIGKNIPSFVTNRIRPDLKGFVEYWSVSSQEAMRGASPEEIAAEKEQGHKYGIYNGFRPGMGAVISDADAIDFRVIPWIIRKYNIDQYFYWSTTFWTKINVFINPATFQNRINGDGTFFYPGQDNLFPEESRNLDGPLSSVRAKNWRRGAQDFEYLWLLTQAGKEKEMIQILNSCVPAALWDAKELKDVSWSNHGYKFEQYRKQMAELLAASFSK